MDTATKWLCPQAIELELEASSKWEALREVSATVARLQPVSAAPVFRALWRREQAGSTSFGNAFAIPHARIAGITEPVTVYVRMKIPLDFAAPDRKPVSDLFVILVPTDANDVLLHLLALVGDMFSDREFRGRLAAASDREDARSAFLQWIDARRDLGREGPAD